MQSWRQAANQPCQHSCSATSSSAPWPARMGAMTRPMPLQARVTTAILPQTHAYFSVWSQHSIAIAKLLQRQDALRPGLAHCEA